MTIHPVMTVTDELLAELEELAISVNGWDMRHAFVEHDELYRPEDLEWYVGAIDEDGNNYPLLTVNAHQYDSDDSQQLARYYAACNRDKILSMTRELRRLRAENADLAQSLAESRANDQAAMGWLTSLRWASGDRGERMLPELVTHIELMAKDAGRYRFLRDKEAERGPSVVDIACWTAGATCIALTYVDADDVDGAVDIAMAAQ